MTRRGEISCDLLTSIELYLKSRDVLVVLRVAVSRLKHPSLPLKHSVESSTSFRRVMSSITEGPGDFLQACFFIFDEVSLAEDVAPADMFLYFYPEAVPLNNRAFLLGG